MCDCTLLLFQALHLFTQLSGQLKSQLLTLTGKLHDGELDRHSLHQQLVDAKLDYQQLSVACNDALSMATTVEKLQQEVWSVVHVTL